MPYFELLRIHSLANLNEIMGQVTEGGLEHGSYTFRIKDNALTLDGRDNDGSDRLLQQQRIKVRLKGLPPALHRQQALSMA